MRIPNAISVFMLLICTFINAIASVPVQNVKVKTSFGKVNIKYPDFSDTKRFDIRDFGAVKGNKHKNSMAI